MFSRLSSALQLNASGTLHAMGMPELFGVADKVARETKADFDMIMQAFRCPVSSSMELGAAEVFSARGMPELIGVAKKLAKMPQKDFDAVLHAFNCYRRAYEIDRKQHAHQFECKCHVHQVHPRWRNCSHAA